MAKGFIVMGDSRNNSLSGSSEDDTIYGDEGNDTINGNAGNDAIIGGVGDDLITGGSGSDIFSFDAMFGRDTITDFNVGLFSQGDILQFKTSVFADWNALQAATRQVGADLVITQSANDVLTLKNVALANFKAKSVQFLTPGNHAPDSLTLSGGTIAENSRARQFVGTLAGTDPDVGNMLVYSLTDDAGGRFAVESYTGRITVKAGAVLDYETAKVHSITARVTDKAGLSFDKTFTINVTNVKGADINGGTRSDTLTGTAEDEVIRGLAGNDRIVANGGADTIDGGTGNDTIDGGAGDDWLIGGAGNDRFIFSGAFGRDTISDFNAAGDLLQFSTATFANWAAVAAATRQVGADLVITKSATDVLTLKNVALANFTADDVRFLP